jgi:hypothetical protein
MKHFEGKKIIKLNHEEEKLFSVEIRDQNCIALCTCVGFKLLEIFAKINITTISANHAVYWFHPATASD